MIYNTYNLDLKAGEEKITVKLRLTVLGQTRLKKKYPDAQLATGEKVPAAIIYSAFDDPTVMADIFTEALTYKDNENSIHDGAELYELLVDNGYAGALDFGPLLLNIAQGAGLLTQGQYDGWIKIFEAREYAQTQEAEEIGKALEEEKEKEKGKKNKTKNA